MVYTDVSKREKDGLAASVSLYCILPYILPLCYFIFTAEFVALILAITKNLSLDAQDILIIISDSTSAIFVLQDPPARNPLVSLQRFLCLTPFTAKKKWIFAGSFLMWASRGTNGRTGQLTVLPLSGMTSQLYLPKTLEAGCLPATEYYSHLRQRFFTCWQ